MSYFRNGSTLLEFVGSTLRIRKTLSHGLTGFNIPPVTITRYSTK